MPCPSARMPPPSRSNWDSVEALAAPLQTPEGQEANRILSEDEARFVDCAASAIFFTVEHTIFSH
jgi:hypothetical protein